MATRYKRAMEKRVKIFDSDLTSRLERDINHFLFEVEGSLHDIKFVVDDNGFMIATLIYTPKKDICGKEKG